MSPDAEVVALDAKIAVYLEERRRLFVRGFAKFVIAQGSGALAPSSEKGKALTWQARGRQIYGAEPFNQVMREELAARKVAA